MNILLISLDALETIAFSHCFGKKVVGTYWNCLEMAIPYTIFTHHFPQHVFSRRNNKNICCVLTVI